MIKVQCKLYVIFALLINFSAYAQNPENSIVVQGVGEVTIDNSEGQINASVTTRNADADQALSNNNTVINSIINELNVVGVSDDDITTSQFNFHPEYNWESGQSVFVGYSVTNGLNIKVSEISAVGAILNLLVDAGATRINSVSFGSSSLSEVRKQALVKATDDALAKAQILAGSTGVVLGQVVQVTLASHSTVLNETIGSSDTSFAGSSAPISPGNNTYRETVNVTYQIDNQ